MSLRTLHLKTVSIERLVAFFFVLPLLAVSLPNAQAAWFAKYDGVDGSTKQEGNATGVGRVGGKMHLEDISLGIISDKSTPKLLEAAAKGKVFSKVEIHGTATYGDAGEQTYLAIELENAQAARNSLLDISGAGTALRRTAAYGKDGSKGGNVEFEWKVEEGESSVEEPRLIAATGDLFVPSGFVPTTHGYDQPTVASMTAVPEPTTFGLLVASLTCLATSRRLKG